MSARDAESGSSTYKGGSGSAGGLGNGGVGGGRGGGGNYGGGSGGGGGAGRNGGINSRTGLTTGNHMYGGTAYGRPGGYAQNPGAWGVHPQPAVSQAPLNRPAVPGLLSPPPAVVPSQVQVQQPVPPTYAPPAWSPPYPNMPQQQLPTYGMPATYNSLEQAISPPYNNWHGNIGAFNSSFYNNPELGTPGYGGSGLGHYSNYSQGSAAGGKGDLGGGGSMPRW